MGRACPFRPIVWIGDDFSRCLGRECALWVDDGEWSSCVFNKQLYQQVTEYFLLRG